MFKYGVIDTAESDSGMSLTPQSQTPEKVADSL